MQKVIVALTAILAMNIGVGFAAPINDLSKGQTALGVGNDSFYIENKLADNFTLGFQNGNRDISNNIHDIYGQFNLSNNFRGIIGNRNFDSGSKTYLGLAVNGPMSGGWDGYGSLIAGDGFKEAQIGANVGIAHNVDLNLNYHTFMPDNGSSTDGVGFGATIKF